MDTQHTLPSFSAQRLGLLVIGLALLAFAFWMWLAPLNSAVVTIGMVKSATNRKSVQHTDGGIIKRVLVHNGDSVVQGQPLVELEDIKVDSNVLLLQEMMVFESAKRGRLDAEQLLLPRFQMGAQEFKTLDRSLVDRAYQRELRIFQTRRGLLDEQLASYQRQMIAVTQEQTALHRQLDSSNKAVVLARDELGINEALVRDNFISRARLISLERAVAEYAAKQGEHEAQIAQSEQRKNDLALRSVSMRSEYQRVAAEEFKDSNARFVQLREQLRPAEDAARRKIVVAPVSGKVVGQRFNAPGEVAAPREPLMEIVPDNEELLVEGKIGVDAIRHLHTDQKAELRFTTFNSRTTPLVLGNVTYISADALADKDGMPYYVVQVRPQPDSLRIAGIQALTPGMAAEMYVFMENRSVIDYLLTPISDTLRRAMREP
jgi:HlyD family type I secretion membrane fusion protein